MENLRATLEQALAPTHRIERELGGGGMSRVFLAEEITLQRKVVIKLLHPALANGLSADRFSREISVAARLQQANIVPVFSAGAAGDLPYYIMPFVKGESLRQRLNDGPLPLTEALPILRDVARALKYAHAEGLVHRDIKPENILISGGAAMVTDFGIAKAVSAARTAGGETLTLTGMSLGTPGYMAPEQAAGGHVDQRTDIYAWGVLAYELISGSHPFPGDTPLARLAAQITNSPPPLNLGGGSLSATLTDLVSRCLAQDPEGRPASANQLLDVLDGMPSSVLPGPRPKSRRPALVFVALVASLVLSGLLLWKALGPKQTASAGKSQSLAVLPFVNVGGDTAQAYFAQGMADELTTTLVQVSNLRVASRSAVARLKSEELTARDAGRELGVETVLEGTVRRSGNRLRVTAQLSNAADGLVLWADRFDREMRDIFEVQDEIARSIVTALQGALAGGTGQRLTRAPRGTDDLEAYDLYLKGRYFWSRRGREGLTKAIDYMNRAVARDPSFARAHAGISMAYAVLPFFDTINPDRAMRLAEQSAARALALDSGLAEAHLALAYALKNRWRFSEAEREFQASLALAPNDAGVRHWYGVFLYAVGRVDESVAQLAQATTLDPFNTTAAVDRAVALYSARRFAEARAELDRTYRMDTTKSDTQWTLSMVYLAIGHPDSAISALEKVRSLGVGYDVRGYLSVAYRRLGRIREADSIDAELERDYRKGGTSASSLAIAASEAGEIPQGLQAIERAFEQRDVFLTEISLPCDPLFDPLKSDPRFERMLAGAGMKMCPPP